MNGNPFRRATLTTSGILLAVLAIAAPPARSQAIGALPAPGGSALGVAEAWTATSVEVPTEISFGTMAVRAWVAVRRDSGKEPLTSLTFVLRDAEGDVRLPMQPLDGAFDSDREDAVVTVDTYAWVRDASHPWEVWARGGEAKPRKLAQGKIRVKPRVATPDLVLVDERGRLTAWLGSGAGGFVPGEAVDCGMPLAPPAVRDVDGDRHPEILMPAVDGALHVLGGARSGHLEAEREVGCGYGLAAGVFGDLDGDGGFDFVTAASPRLLEIRRDLDDLPTQSVDLPLEAEHLALADLDGDGRQEIYVALLGLADETIERWTPSSADSGEWVPQGSLSPPRAGRGRIRALTSLAGSPPGRALLVLSSKGGEAMLESWRGAADIESVYHPDEPRVVLLPGEPLGAVSGRFSDPASPSWLVWIRQPDRVEWWEVPLRGAPLPRGWLEAEPAAVAALDLDGDGDDDLATGGEELRLWINIRGADFREAGESPYLLEARVVALAAGRLDE